MVFYKQKYLLRIIAMILILGTAASQSARKNIPVTGSITRMPASSLSPAPSSNPSPLPLGIANEGYRLVLNENFSGPELNQDVWNLRFRSGTTNPPELEEYVPAGVKVESGLLSLTALPNPNGRFPFTSGMIASSDRFYFQYGYVEIRAKVPKGQGLWPALWLLAQDQKSANEIDIMEVIGKETAVVHTTLHYGVHDGGEKKWEGSTVSGPDFSQDFHTFGVDWQWNKITWYIDGRSVYQVTDHIPREPMFLIANLAVGGNWPGSPDQTTHFPANFYIDYIRVYAPS
jgi:beta-glucanase (GH16 family)